MPRQLLLTTEHFYLLAPAGQVVDGFLGIMTHVCRDGPRRLRCLDDIEAAWSGELQALSDLVARFYSEAYQAPTLFYEHGRGGGQQSSFPGGDFVFHPHLCALPGDLELHRGLQLRFEHCDAPPFPGVRATIGQRPYVYVDTPGRAEGSRPTVYFGGDLDSDERLGALSVKRLLVEANTLPRDADWRRYPGEREIVELVDRFNRWYAGAYRRPTDPQWDEIVAGITTPAAVPVPAGRPVWARVPRRPRRTVSRSA